MPLAFANPAIDWAGLSPELVLLGGAAVVLIAALFVPPPARAPLSAGIAALCFAGALAAAVALFAKDATGHEIVAQALRRDRLAEFAQMLVAGAGLLAVGVSYREPETTGRDGEYYALLLTAVAGMSFFAGANTLLTLFLGLEWFSISLYVLTAIAVERFFSLEAGLKYL